MPEKEEMMKMIDRTEVTDMTETTDMKNDKKCIKLIALDLDGTTLGKGGLSRRTKDALEKAIEKGIHVVIATGRVYAALPEEIFQIKGLEYIITSNGAHITRLPDEEVIYSNCADGEDMERVSHLLEANAEFPIEVFTQGKAYIDRDVFEDLRENGSDYMSVEYIMKTRKPVRGIYEFLRSNKNSIENINVHFRSMEEKKKFWKRLGMEQGITITTSFAANIEIGGRTTSKATALSGLCDILGMDATCVMACGDSHNDIAMIKWAGIGVAMENADEEVKSAAQFITLSNVEDGVAFAVERFALANNRGM